MRRVKSRGFLHTMTNARCSLIHSRGKSYEDTYVAVRMYYDDTHLASLCHSRYGRRVSDDIRGDVVVLHHLDPSRGLVSSMEM
jgi:hypothetical protein